MLEKRNFLTIDGIKKDIVHIIFKRSIIEDIVDDYKEYSSSLRSITKYNLLQEANNSIYELDSLDQLEVALFTAKSHGARIANIWFEGNWPSANWETELLKAVDQWDSEDTSWMCAGHILARKNRIPEFHNQCIVVNLNNHRLMYMTKKQDSYPSFNMSDQHLHDDYTPMYIDGSGEDITIDDDFPEYSLNVLGENFDLLTYPIAVSLKNNLKVHNFDYDLRENKVTCYPEDDLDEGEHILYSLLNPENMKVHKISWIADLLYCKENYIEEDKIGLFDECVDPRFQITSMSHDSSILGFRKTPNERDVDLNVDYMILPCRNFSNFDLISANTNCKSVIWYDYMEEFLTWQKRVVEEWNGVNYIKFHEDVYPSNVDVENYHYYNDNLDMICEDHDDPTLCVKEGTMEKIRELDHRYEDFGLSLDQFYSHLKDVIEEMDNLISFKQNVYIDFSSMFVAPHIISLEKRRSMIQKTFYEIITLLEENFNNVIITGYNPNGIYHEYLNTRFI